VEKRAFGMGLKHTPVSGDLVSSIYLLTTIDRRQTTDIFGGYSGSGIILSTMRPG